MGRPAGPLHDPGNHRPVERRSHRQAARRGRMTPAGQTRRRAYAIAAPTPRQGTRSARSAKACAVLRRAASDRSSSPSFSLSSKAGNCRLAIDPPGQCLAESRTHRRISDTANFRFGTLEDGSRKEDALALSIKTEEADRLARALAR